MPYFEQSSDSTQQYLSFSRTLENFRAVANTTFNSGAVLQLASVDLQVYPDEKTVQLSGTAAAQNLLVGVVAETWPGFNGAGLPATFTSPSTAVTARGTSTITAVTQGYHSGVLLDQSGAGAVTVTNGIPLIASRGTAGYSQGATTPVAGLGCIGVANLPASGIGSSLTAAALAQAAQTFTVAGTPTTGDVYTVTIQAPYNTSTPGVLQTMVLTVPALTSGQAASVTTAAAAVAAYLNTQSGFTQYFIATSSLGVVTVTVNALSNPFLVTFGSSGKLTGQMNIAISGMVANSLTTAASVVGVSTFTAGGATFAAGTGYKGTVPAIITALW